MVGQGVNIGDAEDLFRVLSAVENDPRVLGKKMDKSVRLRPKYPLYIYKVILILTVFILFFFIQMTAALYIPREYCVLLFKTLCVAYVGFFVFEIYQVFWLRALLYEITNEDLIVYSGLLTRKREQTHLYRVKDLTVIKPFHYRIFGCGNIKLISSDYTCPYQTIRCISKVEDVVVLLNRLIETERLRRGVREIDGTYNG